MKTYLDVRDYTYSDNEYGYQLELTTKLDASQAQIVDQQLINEIVLWKLNRFAYVDKVTLALLNSPILKEDVLNINFTRDILEKLLKTPGIRLPVASTILRFRNPKLYQILDQRAYRFIFGKELKLGDHKGIKEKINKHIDLYFDYLDKLKKVALKTGWNFANIDRILYLRDQEFNKDMPIKYA